ncbi:AraC family transcriptional regulator [Shewanella sp. NIFS-20-20]|uniref:AraC family transcriptional regulator n=1 Tax=Shewanella sp. NIFS-20-20 TaxID=2853806 RepID=UPI001C491F1F|nr:AraC family transcriptional regulator [Shewanella sp. NIFS-20-20]MBV7317410.1 AraC family transcriptional regulator [Shewanella sp. NIFS-20-20]
MTTLIPQTPTTIGTWALLLAKSIASYGIDPEPIFMRAELDLNDAKRDHEARFPVRKMAKVWQWAVEETNDPCLALTLTRYFQPSTYSAPGIAMVSSRNVLEGLQRCIRYFRHTTDVALIETHEQGNTLSLSISIPPQNQPCAIEAIEAYSATAIKLFRLMLDDDFSPISVSFSHQGGLAKAAAFAEYFGCAVEFGQARTELTFNRSILLTPHLYANPALAASLDDWINERLSQFSANQFATKVQQYILDNLLFQKLDADSVAEHLHMTTRTMQRHLKKDGVSFQQLLSDSRQHMAIKLVAEKQLTLTEIAHMLGFADQSSFNRAFKGWTGVSPKQYAS